MVGQIVKDDGILGDYIVYHLHDDTSNCNGYADSCSNFKEYIKLAKNKE